MAIIYRTDSGAEFNSTRFFGMLWDGTLEDGATVQNCDGAVYQVRWWIHSVRDGAKVRQYLHRRHASLWPTGEHGGRETVQPRGVDHLKGRGC